MPCLKMKRRVKAVIAIILVTLAACAALVIWTVRDWARQMDPATYASDLDTNPASYAHVTSITETDLVRVAYSYEENTYADAFPNTSRRPNLENAVGHLPAFRLGEDIFVITHKWVNLSAGLAVSDSPDFKNRLETTDHRFEVNHLSGHIYE
jgi:hypothetical protein